MITGIGIPSSQSSSPLPIGQLPNCCEAEQQDNDHILRRGHAAAATSIQLHLAVTNEIREASVPNEPSGTDRDRQTIFISLDSARSTNGNPSVEGAKGNDQSG